MGQQDLPLAAGSAHVKTFGRCGWEVKRLSKKNHYILQHDEIGETLSIPNHKEVKRGLLAKQIARAQLTEEEYLEAFYGR